ncbi:growth/differentiation factor 15 [Phodopus roborovskii]|uniref:Growth/differentiation factor 15 n=1 Tax=Phodopus roborovskii TaxID=109678 RepID=A0AAU9YX95_PHORO|nr:growth/differentiation factor 15 [Phodopus roborovskii]CAH6779739.1 Gdf15 [Phodopus roborovskii]
MALPAPEAQPPGSSQLRFLLFLMMLLLLMSWPSPGDSLALSEQRRSHLESQLDAHELRGRFQDLLRRLHANQSQEDSNSEPIPTVRILTPKVRLGPRGHLLLHVRRASLTQGLPEAYRVHRALLLLTPSSRPWDVTATLQRALSLGGPRNRALRLRLAAPPDVAVTPSSGVRLELHLRPPAGRGRRSAHARLRDSCPLGPGRCCHLQTVQATLEDLGWSDWVLSPRQLQLSMCVGECPHLYRLASTHAQIKARLHGLQPDRVPAPCCVPSSYTPVVLMHQTNNGVSLQTYDDMVARGCHCA